jgi:hypothetical protein
MSLQQGYKKNKLFTFIGVPINYSVHTTFYTYNPQVFMGKNHFFFIFHASVILQYYYSMCVTFSFILGHGTPFIQSHSTHQQHQMLLRPRDHCTPMMKTLSKHENEVFTCIYLFLWKSFSFFYWFETFLRPRTSFKWLKSTVAKSTDLLGKTDSRKRKWMT